MNGRRIGGLKTRVGQERCIGREGARWTRLNSGGIQAGEAQRDGYNVSR